MKKSTLSIDPRLLLMGVIVFGSIWLGGCTNRGQAPTAILPVQPSNDIRSGAQMPSATTISDDNASTVTFNPDATKIDVQVLVADLGKPIFVTHAGDNSGRIFVVEQRGVIRIVRDGEVEATPFLDISDRVNDGKREQGLLGLAFSPDYAENGLFFVNYTDESGDTVVARYASADQNPDRADVESETLVLRVEQPAGNHNGGMMAFGPDGMLYLGLGDGGGANDRYRNGQNPETLLGKMLRINVADPSVPYTVPADNPWVAMDWEGKDVRDEVWAVGLRNPWRFSFDRQSGSLWIGDVGQNQYEEINFVASTAFAPINFGWPIMESTHCVAADECDQAGLWPPAIEIEHKGNCSVTGGYVYRGRDYPDLMGVYLFGDFCSGKIWAALPGSGADAVGSDVVGLDASSADSVTVPATDGAIQWRVFELLDTELSISSFGEDEAGELYVTDLNGGTLSRLVVVK